MSGCPECYIASTDPRWLAELVARFTTDTCARHAGAHNDTHEAEEAGQ